MNFEDRNTYDGVSTFYPVCNENLKAWKDVLGDISVKRAAGICSGGEVSFFTILPRVEQELVLIDHNYGSLYYALGKYYVIEEAGAKEAYELLSTYHPPPIYSSSRLGQDTNGYGRVSELFANANEGLPTCNSRSIRDGVYRRLAAIWCSIALDEVEQFRENREKIRFLHGDINDLLDEGPFDLVYLSNALDYAGRNGKDFKIKELVSPGGYIALANQSSAYYPGTYKAYVKDCELVADVRPKAEKLDRTDYSYGYKWNYLLYRVPQAKEA